MRFSLPELREKNVKRSRAIWHPDRGIWEWSVTDWGCALGGECGEAQNIAKKIRRLDGYFLAIPSHEQSLSELRQALAMELADVILYADLLAARAGIDLELAIQTKFNMVSEEHGCEIRL